MTAQLRHLALIVLLFTSLLCASLFQLEDWAGVAFAAALKLVLVAVLLGLLLRDVLNGIKR